MSKTAKVPVTWVMWGYFEIEYETLEDLQEKVFDAPIEQALEAHYLDDSFQVNTAGIEEDIVTNTKQAKKDLLEIYG